MAIPYLLMGNIGEKGTYLRKDEGHFERQRIDLRSGRATRVDTAARRLHLESGDPISFDRLLIATGATPVRPPIPGMLLATRRAEPSSSNSLTMPASVTSTFVSAASRFIYRC